MRRLPASGRDSDLAYLALLALVFAISRAAVYVAGVRFATGQLTIAIQNLDPELLRHRLLQSVWYLHIQPPLWNLGLGVILKLFPSHWGAAFHVIYLALGLIEILALYALISGFGLPRPAAAAVAAFVSVSPDVMLYESWLFYDYPLLVLITLSALAAQRYARTPTFWRATALFGLLASIVLMRALYQLIWVFLVVALLLVFRVGPRTTVLRAAAFPVAFLLAFSIKQAVMFGTPTTTTWFGENLARIAIFTVPKDERERLVQEGKLSRIALVRTFAPLEDYRDIVKPSSRRGIPALDERWKSNHKDLNLNNYGYIAVSNAYRHQALRQIKERPGEYARGIKLAAERFLWPASYTGLPGQNIDKLSAWRSVYDILYGSSSRANRVSFFLGLGYLIAGAFGLAVLLRERGPVAFGLSFIWLTLIYTTLVGTLTDYGENYRLRLAVDPIAATLLSVACYRAWVAVHSCIRGRRRAATRDGKALA